MILHPLSHRHYINCREKGWKWLWKQIAVKSITFFMLYIVWYFWKTYETNRYICCSIPYFSITATPEHINQPNNQLQYSNNTTFTIIYAITCHKNKWKISNRNKYGNIDGSLIPLRPTSHISLTPRPTSVTARPVGPLLTQMSLEKALFDSIAQGWHGIDPIETVWRFDDTLIVFILLFFLMLLVLLYFFFVWRIFFFVFVFVFGNPCLKNVAWRNIETSCIHKILL